MVASIGGSRTAIAKAAVLRRAAAALAEQPNTILYLQVHDYGYIQLCLLAGECIGVAPSHTHHEISANPANDTLSFSFRRWLSPDGSELHTLYSSGDETASNKLTRVYEHYDPADNTLTTLSDAVVAKTPASTGIGPLLSTSDFTDPSYFESLYKQAEAGEEDAQLLGRTRIDGESVYELRFVFKVRHPAYVILLYIDSQTFTPVRLITGGDASTYSQPGIPDGPVANVTDFVLRRLPDTRANAKTLDMSPHPGAKQIRETEKQYDR